MLLSRLAETRIALAATRSRNAKRDLIAAVLRDASSDDVEIVVSYLSGSLRQRRTGVGWKSLQAAPPPAAEATRQRLWPRGRRKLRPAPIVHLRLAVAPSSP